MRNREVANVNLPVSGQCLGTQQLACCNTGNVNQVSLCLLTAFVCTCLIPMLISTLKSGTINVNFGGICPVIF